MLLSGCRSNNEIKYYNEFSCRFSDGTVTGLLTLNNDIVHIDDFSLNNESFPLNVTVTDSEYTVTTANISKTISFSESTDIPALVLMGRIVLQTHLMKSMEFDEVTVDQSGNIGCIVSKGVKYSFYDYKISPGQ